MSASVTLRRGTVSLPLFGLGTWKSTLTEIKEVIKSAFDVGYTLIDTATVYDNEEAIGEALALSGRPRDSFCIVTKLPSSGHPNVEKELRASLARLQLEYVDVYLVHSANGKHIVDTWMSMLKVRDLGLARAVGVSNFGHKHIAELEKLGLELPEVNQIEFHVWNQQREDAAYLKEKNIAIMGYCPLARGKKFGTLGGSTAEEANWAMRWSIEQGVVTIPKTTNMDRLRSNFEQAQVPLSKEKKTELDALDEKFHCSSACAAMDLAWDEIK